MSLLSVRGSLGLHLVEGADTAWQKSAKLTPDSSKNIKVVAFSPDGNLLAWSNGDVVHVAEWNAQNLKFAAASFGALPHARVSFLAFSPCGSYLATWELFAIRSGQGAEPNLHIWAIAKDGAKVASFIQKKNAFWCPQWSKDGKICSPNNELNFYADGDFSKVAHRLSIAKLDTFNLSPSAKGPDYPIVVFIPGQKGGPGFAKLFCYPRFHPEKDFLAYKSFMQADRLDVEWSCDGKLCLLLSQADVDKTGASYYGKQQLHFMNQNGDTAMIQLAKEGPIYAITWSPTHAEFCVVYGYMPAKATIYNAKCEKVFDFGTGPRNMAMYNPQGTIIMLAGFGNLRGNIEMWSIAEKREIVKFEAADSTDVKWSPDGTRILTSTCAPRLRQGNGFKIWHYTSSLLHEESLPSASDELWEVCWQSRPEEGEKKFNIQYRPVPGITPKQPVASKQAYRPPSMRNTTKPASAFKLHDEDELAENVKKTEGNEKLSKSAAKNKKRKENAAKKKANEAQQADQPQSQPASKTFSVSEGVDPEVGKKLRKLNDKLTQIEKLKEQQKQGKKLELNQLEKLKKEAEILEEIKKLQIQ